MSSETQTLNRRHYVPKYLIFYIMRGEGKANTVILFIVCGANKNVKPSLKILFLILMVINDITSK